MAAPGQEQDDVERTLPEDLVGNADLAVAGVVGLRRHRRRIGGAAHENQAHAAQAEEETAPETPEPRQEDADEAQRPHAHPSPRALGARAVALGIFLGAVLYFGWNGGYVGGWLGEGLDKLIGDAKYVVPVALVVLGALVVTRSALVDVRPFRTGMAVLGCGLMITLGKDQGGYVGQLLGGGVGVALGATGSLLLGVLLMLVGSLLLTEPRSGRFSAARGAASTTRGEERGQGPVTGGSHRDVSADAAARAAGAVARFSGRRRLGLPRRRRRELRAAARRRAARSAPD